MADSALKIAGYRVLATLGRGGEGTVHLAESTDGLGKKVALKTYAAGASAAFERELAAYRKIEEIRASSGTRHLAEGLAAGRLPDGGGFLALAWQEAGSLAERVKREGPLGAGEAVAIARQVLEALALLHAGGIAHRDVKPSNVLLGRDGAARLADFGLAGDGPGSGGTPAFAAPEAGSDGAAGEALDIYGAGATLYFLLTGRPPAPGRPDIFALEARRVPRALQEAILRSLAREPGARFSGASELSSALASSMRVDASAAIIARRGIWRRALGLTMVIAVAAMALGLARRWPEERPEIQKTQGSPGCSIGDGLVAVAGPLDAVGAQLFIVEAASGRTRTAIALPARAVVLASAGDGRVVVGAADGRVYIVDPAESGPPREVAAFGRAVMSIEVSRGVVRARGDDRKALALGPSEAAPADSIVLETSAGRVAFLREPAVRTIEAPLPAR